MLRVIIQTDDAQMAANVGGSVHSSHKIFDVELPEVERYLTENLGPYVKRRLVGVEILET